MIFAQCLSLLQEKYSFNLSLSLSLPLSLFLSSAVTEPIYHSQLARDYLQKHVNPVLTTGLTQLCKKKPEDPLVRRITRVPSSSSCPDTISIACM